MPLSDMRKYYIEKDSRINVAVAFLGLLFLLIVGGLFYHQVIRYSYFQEQSENNRIRIRPIIPKRGVIYDRNMQMIADNRLSFSVSIIPCETVKGVTIPRLAELMGVDTLEIKQKAAANAAGNYIPALVRRDQGIEVISALEENADYYPGVTYSIESVRRYEKDVSAETFIGYIGEVSPEEVDLSSQKGYRPGRLIGKKGLEKTYDQQLRGLEGTDYIEISARGQVIGSYTEKEKIPAVPGADLVLGIDMDLQKFIVANFDSLQYSGGVVAIDPSNGEVIAMASFPSFDPNLFSGIIPADQWQAIIEDPNHPLLNRPTTGLYPPGSTAKLLTAGAALEEGLISEDELLRGCGGGMRFGNRVFKCWEPRGHGSLTMIHAIEHSCDVYFYQVGMKLGVDLWSKYANACGFVNKTGVDITGELGGICPSSSYYNRVYGKNGWTKIFVVNLAIGQGEFTITPLQLAQFYCGLANNGIVYRPHLVREIRYADGHAEAVKPVESFHLPFSEKNLYILQEALKLVVQGSGGTARGLRNKNYWISGKTGTAQNPHGRDHSWFVGFAPSEAPQIVVCVLVENAGHGSEVAAPLCGKIIKQYLVPPPKEDSAKALPVAQSSGEAKLRRP